MKERTRSGSKKNWQKTLTFSTKPRTLLSNLSTQLVRATFGKSRDTTSENLSIYTILSKLLLVSPENLGVGKQEQNSIRCFATVELSGPAEHRLGDWIQKQALSTETEFNPECTLFIRDSRREHSGEVRLHVRFNKWLANLNNVHVSHLVDGWCPDDVPDVNDIFMPEASQDFDLSQGTLAVGLMFERGDFFDGHFLVSGRVSGRPEKRIRTS